MLPADRVVDATRKLASTVITATVAWGLVAATPPTATAGLVGITVGPNAVLYDINESTGAPSNPRTVGNKVNCIAVSPGGVLYGVSQGFPSDVPTAGHLFTITVTGVATQVATLDQFIVTEGDIAFDPTTGILYGVDSQGDLFKINTTTGACTSVGDVSAGNIDLSAMAFDASGNLYMVDSFGPSLLQVNKANAQIISSQSMGAINQEIGGLVFRPGDGTLFHSAGTSSVLYTVATNGTPTTLGPIGVQDGIWSLAYLPDTVHTEPATWSRMKALWR
jgi:hypothetical protein